MRIDCHAHVWPDHVAPRALGGNIPGMKLFGDGTVSGLRAAQDAAGIDRSICLAVANNPSQVHSANRFVGSCDRDRLIPFGTIHPGLPVEENIESLRQADVMGVKLHPIFQGYRLDDPALYGVLDALSGWLPVIVHVGAGGGGDGSTCTPGMLVQLSRTFPLLTVIACHLGGYLMFDTGAEVRGAGVYLDTSWPPSLAELDPQVVRRSIRDHGVERVLFASDWPTADPAAEVAAVERLGLSDEETEAVLGANAAQLLGIAS